MRVNLEDLPADYSLDQIKGLMWTGDLYHRSVSGYYEEASFGAVTFPADTNQDRQADIVDVSIPYLAANGCRYSIWANAADQAAKSQGIDLSIYQHKIYALPENNLPCNWYGLGTLACIDGGNCRSWIRFSAYSSVYAHELGHNLGMNHARLDLNYDGIIEDEYGDWSDIMGDISGFWKHFNAPHKAQMGWLPKERIRTVTEDGIYDLAVLELHPSEAVPKPPTDIQALRIPVDGKADTYLYLSFRGDVAEYSGAFGNSKITFINRYQEGTGYSDLVSTSYDYARWYDGTGISIHQVSHTDTSAEVEIKFDDFPPKPGPTLMILSTPTPTPTKSPTATATSTPIPEASLTPTPVETVAPSAPPTVTPTPGQEHSYSLSIARRRIGNSYTLHGRLRDKKQPVAGAVVKLVYKKSGVSSSSKRFRVRSKTQTNKKGRYFFTRVKRSGTYRARALGVRSPVVGVHSGQGR